MKKIIKYLLATLIIFSAIFIGWRLGRNEKSDILVEKISTSKPKRLDKYTIENLASSDIKPGEIEIDNVINEEKEYSSYLFTFTFNPNLDGKTMKKTTGQINLPPEQLLQSSKNFPIIVMLRGYIDKETFQTGDGTRRAAEYFAKNGYITIAPDFLGYGGSDEESASIFETRFQTYVTVLSLLKTLENLNSHPELVSGPNQVTNQLINQSSISLWSHSNGGHIALTVLEITGKDYPTTLWAPVSKFFPYSVLYYTDESEDRGKLIREELAKFEEQYDTDKYSLDLYLNRIKAPLQIHQGTADEAVPVSWSEQLRDKLLGLNIELKYYEYPGTNHNMVPGWDTVISRDLDFFNKNLE